MLFWSAKENEIKLTWQWQKKITFLKLKKKSQVISSTNCMQTNTYWNRNNVIAHKINRSNSMRLAGWLAWSHSQSIAYLHDISNCCWCCRRSKISINYRTKEIFMHGIRMTMVKEWMETTTTFSSSWSEEKKIFNKPQHAKSQSSISSCTFVSVCWFFHALYQLFVLFSFYLLFLDTLP